MLPSDRRDIFPKRRARPSHSLRRCGSPHHERGRQPLARQLFAERFYPFRYGGGAPDCNEFCPHRARPDRQSCSSPANQPTRSRWFAHGFPSAPPPLSGCPRRCARRPPRRLQAGEPERQSRRWQRSSWRTCSGPPQARRRRFALCRSVPLAWAFSPCVTTPPRLELVPQGNRGSEGLQLSCANDPGYCFSGMRTIGAWGLRCACCCRWVWISAIQRWAFSSSISPASSLRVTSSRNRSKKVFIAPPSSLFFYGTGKPRTRLGQYTLSSQKHLL